MSTESFAHHFSLANIPFGIASSTTHPTPAAVTRIGDDVYFLDKLFELGIFKDVPNISLHTFTQVRSVELWPPPSVLAKKISANLERICRPWPRGQQSSSSCHTGSCLRHEWHFTYFEWHFA